MAWEYVSDSTVVRKQYAGALVPVEGILRDSGHDVDNFERCRSLWAFRRHVDVVKWHVGYGASLFRAETMEPPTCHSPAEGGV